MAISAWRFDSLLEARVITENWWTDDNTNRPRTDLFPVSRTPRLRR
jgi:hypothetical protein